MPATGVAAAAEVPGGEGVTERVARFRVADDAVDALVEELAAAAEPVG